MTHEQRMSVWQEVARGVLRAEAAAILAVASRIDDRFTHAVSALFHADRVITSGIGKSGIIARKIAATLTSTGTPATFVHPVDALHGDLGYIGRDDVALLVSASGETHELLVLARHLHLAEVGIVSLTPAITRLACGSDVVLDTSIAGEACPHGLAPTTSTAVAMALGDALAVTLMEARGVTADDFLRLHPGGTLGRRTA